MQLSVIKQENDYTEVDGIKSPKHTLIAQEHPVLLGSPLSPAFRSVVGTKCASCGGNERLSLLEPCQHQICASCITGSLNVVGEKDMICMYCLSPIKSFKIARPFRRIHSDVSSEDSFSMHPLCQNSFPQDSPTPRESHLTTLSHLDARPSSDLGGSFSIVVLRIDNVPWVCIYNSPSSSYILAALLWPRMSRHL
jgi:hypothetical protein